MNREICLLDCTLRDGGFALEQSSEHGFTFSEDVRADLAKNLTEAAIDIIELGTVETNEADKKGYAIFRDMYEISSLIPTNKKSNQMYAVFFRGPDISLDELPDWNESMCQLIRLSVRYSEFDKSLKYCEKLCEKGYKVSIQPIVTIRYTDKELDLLVDAANDMGAYALYFVDSYGSMYAYDVQRVYQKFDKRLKQDIKIGFHAHNNLGFAMSNVMNMLSLGGNRNVILDCCCVGMGQGAGNLQTEVIASYLNNVNYSGYDFISILKACDLVSGYWSDNLWGYSVSAMIPAVYKAAYKYGLVLRNEYHLSYAEIANTIKNISDDMRYRYTRENLEKLLEKAR